jgi:superfamily II RNA helicase
MAGELIRVITGPFQGTIENLSLKFPYKSDHFQQHSFVCIDRGEHVLVLAHTGSGKTAVAEYGIARHLRLGNKIVYTTPIKALSNQKYRELYKKFEIDFSQELGRPIEVGIMTGDCKIKPTADIIIMTTEILANALLQINRRESSVFDEDFLTKLGCVVFDEVHYINNKERGPVWEKTINLLDPKVQMIMLSATIESPQKIAQIVVNKSNGIPVNMIPTNHRVVPLEHYIYHDLTLYKIMDKSEKFLDEKFDEAHRTYQKLEKERRKGYSREYRLNEMVLYLKKKNMLQAIFFCFSKANCAKFANALTCNLNDHDESAKIKTIFEHHIQKIFAQNHDLKTDVEFMRQHDLMLQLLPKGIAYHHAGVAQSFREIIEIIFSEGLIKVLFATETFAVGINMPTRTVVFTEVEKNNNSGRRLLETAEYKQMAGRAGRRGIDTFGFVIILPLYDFPLKQDMKNIMQGSLPAVKSYFEMQYSFILQNIQSETKSVRDFIDHSLFQMDTDVMLVGMDKEILALKTEVDKVVFTEEDILQMDKYLQLDEEEKRLKEMGLTMNKQQKREREVAKQELSGETKRLYTSYKKFVEQKQKLKDICDKRYACASYIQIESNVRLQLLRSEGYIIPSNRELYELGPTDLSPKGILASQINDCNSLLLTEIIMGNIFDGLEPEEIVAILGIFIDDVKSEERKTMKNIQCSDEVYYRLEDIQEIIDRYDEKERKLDIIPHHNESWEIFFDYVDIGYLWATGHPIAEIDAINRADGIQLDVGNFERAIKKLNNMVDNLIKLCSICGKEHYIPTLEKIKPLINRNIIVIPSLYVI